MFQHFDRNHDGMLTQDPFMKGLKASGKRGKEGEGEGGPTGWRKGGPTGWRKGG